MTTLSIIIPVYNEEQTIEELLHRINQTPLPNIKKEIIIVNDGSTDTTAQLLKNTKHLVLSHTHRLGKGAAIRTALPHTTGDYILIQDADLEYHPKEYTALLQPLLQNKSDVVFGSRRLHTNKKSSLTFAIGGILATQLTNLLYHTKYTDIATGYKVFRRATLLSIPFTNNDFSFEPELITILAKRNIKITEIAIDYTPRSRSEGKKITLLDGAPYFWTILRGKFT